MQSRRVGHGGYLGIRFTMSKQRCIRGPRGDGIDGYLPLAQFLGDQVAQALSDRIPVDEQLQWQVYVPYNYDASNPPGVIM